MNDLPSISKIHELAKQKAIKIVHNDVNFSVIFIDGNGRKIEITDQYPMLPNEEKKEIFEAFLHWLNS